MIYTVTVNPALDYVMYGDGFSFGSINKSAGEEVYYGGKGINVSVVLNNLGIKNTALGFIAGFSGDELERGVSACGINTDFIRLADGMTRINVKLRDGAETDINSDGPNIGAADVDKLLDKISRLRDADYLVVSGSIPKCVPNDLYERILRSAADKNTKFVVDATGDALLKTLKYRPFLIKPNHIELADVVGRPTDTDEEVIDGAVRLADMGAENVLVSRGEKGAILVSGDKVIKACAPKCGRVINTVGAGDSSVAGFIAGYIEKAHAEYALKLAVCCGTSGACSKGLAGKGAYALMENTPVELIGRK